MKQILFKVMGGAVFCLSLMFSSCGNIDNPLEEIGNNSTVVALSGALEEGAEVSFNFKFVVFEYEVPIQVKFKRESDKFTFIDAEYDIPGIIDENLADDIDEMLEEILSEENVEKVIKLEYDKTKNQLKASFVYSEDFLTTRNGGAEEDYPLLTVVFDISNNNYTQYVYPSEGFFIWDGVSVNGEDKTSLLSTDYSEKAGFYSPDDDHGNARAVSRTRAQDVYFNFLRVYYKDGETWADVNKRYKEIAGNPLLKAYGDFTEEDLENMEIEGIEQIDGHENIALLYMYKIPCVPFVYFGDYTGEEIFSNLVKTDDKVGYKADGTTANPEGYLIASGD